MVRHVCDVVVVGGGAVGSATALFLRELGFTGSVTVLEKDASYEFASTTRSAASIRQQFTTPVSTEMSQFGFAFMASAKQTRGPVGDIGLVRGGYLLLADAKREAMLRGCHAQFTALGSNIAWLDPDALAARFPWLNVSDLAGGTLGLSGEGWFDAHLLLGLYRSEARDRGVTFVEAEVNAVERVGDRIMSVTTGTGDVYACGTLVNAAGTFAGRLAGLAGIPLPVEPRKRTMFVFKAPLEGAGMPFLFDNSGIAMRPEGNLFLGSAQPSAERDPHPELDFEPDHYLFEEVIWPALAHRIPAMEQVRLTRAWAGHYDMNLFDHNGVIGRHPAVENFIFANGFSGHGVMHSPATGRGVAELIVHGRYVSIDLAPLAFERIAEGRPVREALVY